MTNEELESGRNWIGEAINRMVESTETCRDFYSSYLMGSGEHIVDGEVKWIDGEDEVNQEQLYNVMKFLELVSYGSPMIHAAVWELCGREVRTRLLVEKIEQTTGQPMKIVMDIDGLGYVIQPETVVVPDDIGEIDG